MKRHLVFFYWLLLMVATLAIGGVTFYLLQREGDRLRNMAEDNAKRTGQQTIATNLNFLVNHAKTISMDALSKLPADNIGPNMMNLWKDSYPSVRSVFLYDPNIGLEFPFAHTPERDFLEPLLHTPRGGWVWDESRSQLQRHQMIANFQSRFSSSNNFPGPGAQPPLSSSFSGMGHIDSTANTSVNDLRNNSGNETTNLKGPPNSDLSLAANTSHTTIQLPNGSTISVTQESSQQTITMVAPVNPPAEPASPEQDWVLVGSRELFPHWLGWARAVPGGRVRGLLLSWDALEKSMGTAFPEKLDPADGFILKNPAGNAVIARFANGALVVGGHGSDPIDDVAAKPAFAPVQTINFGPETEMPGWRLEVYFNPEAKFSSNFMAIGTVLVTVLVISVLLGGTLLMREARREAFEAARKTSFVSNVSHELKTPLTTIRMYAELLGEGRVRDPAKQRTYLTTIISESQRLTRLVNNVLNFSRLEQGRKQYHPDNVSLTEVVQSVLDAQHPRLEEAGFQVEADLAAAADLHVRTDRDALEQVMLNLIDNALKYAAEGHWLGVRISHDAEQAILSVSDHGPGVAADEREKIFDMFHRVDDSITARLPGAGLGLSIARRLLRDQEGDLHYVPNSPCGASFVASLPLAVAVGKNRPAPV